MKEIYCLDVTDYSGRKTVFTEQQWTLKSEKRPELREASILKRIAETVTSPHFVYRDLEHTNRFAYYRTEYTINRRVRYMKVILHDRTHDLFVITAYRPNYVKERGKTKLLYGEDSK